MSDLLPPPKQIERYDLTVETNEPDHGNNWRVTNITAMRPCATGKWVRFDAAERLTKQNARLVSALSMTGSELPDGTQCWCPVIADMTTEHDEYCTEARACLRGADTESASLSRLRTDLDATTALYTLRSEVEQLVKYARHEDICNADRCRVCHRGSRLEDGDCSFDKHGLHAFLPSLCICGLDQLLATLTDREERSGPQNKG